MSTSIITPPPPPKLSQFGLPNTQEHRRLQSKGLIISNSSCTPRRKPCLECGSLLQSTCTPSFFIERCSSAAPRSRASRPSAVHAQTLLTQKPRPRTHSLCKKTITREKKNTFFSLNTHTPTSPPVTTSSSSPLSKSHRRRKHHGRSSPPPFLSYGPHTQNEKT